MSPTLPEETRVPLTPGLPDENGGVVAPRVLAVDVAGRPAVAVDKLYGVHHGHVGCADAGPFGIVPGHAEEAAVRRGGSVERVEFRRQRRVGSPTLVSRGDVQAAFRVVAQLPGVGGGSTCRTWRCAPRRTRRSRNREFEWWRLECERRRTGTSGRRRLDLFKEEVLIQLCGSGAKLVKDQGEVTR